VNIHHFQISRAVHILNLADVLLVMASAVLSHLQNMWPLSILKTDNLKLSNQLVRKLSVPDQTKKFVFAAREPDSHAIIYILAAQILSKQSALDAEQLIKEVQPKAVVCLVASSALAEIQEEDKSLPGDQANNVPTSSFGVLKKCLVDKISKEQYERFARCQVLGEIFGTGLYDHFFAAKKAAVEIGSQFILLESPYERSSAAQLLGNVKTGDNRAGPNLKASPGKVVPDIDSSSRRFCLTDTLQSQVVNLLLPSIKPLLKKEMSSDCEPKAKHDESQPKREYDAPPFAQSIYPVLADLHDIFSIIPAIEKALTSAQEMLSSVNKGEPVDTQVLSEVHNFRIAIEALRIALNEAARYPLEDNRKASRLVFSQISPEDTNNAICAQALKSQARKFGSLVAIVDAGKLAGLRRHWTTPVPPEVADLTDTCFTHYYRADLDADEEIETELLADKPAVAVGAGATAVLRATSLLKTVPVYALIKLATFKLPASVKFGLEHLQRTAGSGLYRSGGVTPSTLNLSASAEMIRAVAHGLIAFAEKTGLLAVQTSFYEVMRQRRATPGRFVPYATFCCSMATCTGLVLFKDRIQCAADSIPSVPMIASMGRGLERMQQASEEVRQRSGTKMQETSQSLVYNLKKMIKIQ